MCFYHGDYDWIARSVEQDMRKSTIPVRCDECHHKIPPGAEYQHTEMREHEECQRCQDECSEKYEHCHPACAEGVHDFGEESEHDVCGECLKMLAAIQYVEADDGCVGDETQPATGELLEAMWESDHATEYIDRARQEFPELAASGYLDAMYRRTREWERETEEQWDEDDTEPTDELGGEA